MGVSNLHNLLEKSQDEFTALKNFELNNKKSFLNKIPFGKIPQGDKLKSKILPGSEIEQELDSLLGKAAIQATQLRSCRNCTCLNCKEDNCKFSCFVCHASSYVKYCHDECIRECNNWNITIQGNIYSVKYMTIVHKTEHAYLFLQKQGENSLKPMVYNNRLGTVKYPQEEHRNELERSIEIIKEFLEKGDNL